MMTMMHNVFRKERSNMSATFPVSSTSSVDSSLLSFLEEQRTYLATLYRDVPIDEKYKYARPEIAMERMALARDWTSFLTLVRCMNEKAYRTSPFTETLERHYASMGDILPPIPDHVRRRLLLL